MKDILTTMGAMSFRNERDVVLILNTLRYYGFFFAFIAVKY